MMLGWALAFLTCLAVVLQISGVPIDVSDDEFNFKQVEAVEQLASRLFAPLNTTIGSAFHYQLVSKTDSVLDSFEIATQREADVVTVTVSGTSGVALSAGLYHYLRYYCSSSVTWGRGGTSRPKFSHRADGSGIHLESTLLRQPLPQLSSPVAFELTKQRYYLNFCTTSYSFAFASLEQWLEEVDWMALHGINLPLATTGTEHTIAEAFGPDGLGLTEQELLDFFPGPAFLAWNRMANLDGPFAGPLSKSWRDKRAVLSRAVFQRMRDFGMNIVLPGFSGHLPCSLQRVFPKMKLSARPHWQGYNSSCLLDPSDPYFPVIATAFYKTQQTIFGPTRYFAADQFNEMEPSSGSTVDYLRNMSASVYEAMTSFQSDAVWVMQAWFVVEIPLCKTGQTAYCKSFWLQNVTSRAYPGPFPRLQAYLSGVPHGSLLILDLEANLYPVYSYTDNFYGHDFIWCTIHNFGQTPGVWGDLRALIEGPLAARHAAPNNMAGIGLTMEGVHNNPAVYEVCTEMAYRNATVDVGAWATTFAQSRYGVATPECQEAWALMVSSVLTAYVRSHPVMQGPYSTATQPMQIISSMASLHLVTSSPLPPATVPTANNLTTDTAIARKLLSCGETLRAAGGDVPSTLVYDTVDMVRQSLDGFLWDMSRLFEGVYHRNDTIGAHRVADKWRGVALTLDDVLSADVNFMLGPWIADARATAGGETAAERAREADELDYNARNQITLWGPVPSTGLERYARKQWAGVVKTFYLEGTWGTLLDAALVSLDSHQPVDLAAVAKQTYDIELNWQTNLTLSFPVAPVRNTSGAAMDYIAQLVEPFLNLSSVVASFDRRPNVSALPSLHLLPQTTWSRDVAHMAWLCDADVKCGGYYQIDPSHDLQPTPTVDLWLRR